MRDKIDKLLNAALDKDPSLFLIDLKISADNQIQVIIDGDNGVTVEDCMKVSREIEHNLDREAHDFALTVMSAGLTEPLVFPRQFKKSIGRKLKIKTTDGEQFKGELLQVTDDDCTITWSVRERKPVGKGKITVQKEAVVPYKNIKEAKVMITF